MSLLAKNRSILFMRVPKCGSTYTRTKLIQGMEGKKILSADQNPDKIAWLDFRKNQLETLVNNQNSFLATEYFSPLGTEFNRYFPFWEPEQARSQEEAALMFQKYKSAGWFTVCFLRHPGDLLCSMYHYGVDAAKANRWYFRNEGQSDRYFYWFDPNESLDDFISRSPMALPRLLFNWKEVDFIDTFTPQTVSNFAHNYLGVDISDMKHENKSSNTGYEDCCGRGLISKKNQDRIEQSDFNRVYKEVLRKSSKIML